MKVAKEVWSEIEIRTIRRVIKSWSFCVDLIVQKLSFQVEHFSQCEGIILVTRGQLLRKWLNVNDLSCNVILCSCEKINVNYD